MTRTRHLAACLLSLACLGVGGSPKPIAIEINPQVASVNAYIQTTFKVRVHIPHHKDNRLWSYSASCGSEIKSSEHQLDANSPILYEWYEDLTVEDDCIFQACLVNAKAKTTCDYFAIRVHDYDGGGIQ